MDAITDAATWAAVTFRHAALGDVRRERRLVAVAAALARAPAAPLPEVFATWAEAKAGYALLRNPAVHHEQILLGPTAATAARAAGRRRVLLVGDTTEADFTPHAATRGLGHIGDGRGRGLMVHTVLAVDPETGEPLGVAAQRIWIRRGRKGRSRSTARRGRRRESQVWGETELAAADALAGVPDAPAELIAIDDAGADVYDHLVGLTRRALGFVVCAAQDRALLPDESDGATRLREAAAAAPVLVRTWVHVPAGPGRAAREAAVEVRSAQVTVRPPASAAKDAPPLEIGVVWVHEPDPPPGVEPLAWRLLTSEPIETAAQVLAVVAMYRLRWLVEEFHMGLKTGCALETRQLGSGHALRNLIALCSAIACALLRLRHAARAAPAAPATAVLTPRQLTVLRALRPRLPAEPTARDALRWIANLGGFLMRTRDGEPGWRTIWRGFQHLRLAENGFAAAVRNG